MSLSATQINDGAAAKPRRAATPIKYWVAPLTAMTFVLGLLISLALRSEFHGRPGGYPGTSPVTIQGTSGAYWSLMSRIYDLKDQVQKLQDDNQKLMTGSTRMEEMGKEVENARMAAGLTIVHGPGIVVTLKDSARRPPPGIPATMNTELTNNYIIHDIDIQRVVNELRSGGAENIAVNDERIVASSAIRCVGPAIQVNGNPLTPPFNVDAIGNPNRLSEALSLPGGIKEQLDQADPAMISVAANKDITLPAYDGTIRFRYSKPVDQTSDKQTR
jgi:uncharacterized protein YlxW (UPF0749 family)